MGAKGSFSRSLEACVEDFVGVLLCYGNAASSRESSSFAQRSPHSEIWPVMEQGAKREPGHTVCTRQVKKGGISFVAVLANIHCT